MLADRLELAPEDWAFRDAITQNNCETEEASGSFLTRQTLDFDECGSFVVHGRNPSNPHTATADDGNGTPVNQCHRQASKLR